MSRQISKSSQVACALCTFMWSIGLFQVLDSDQLLQKVSILLCLSAATTLLLNLPAIFRRFQPEQRAMLLQLQTVEMRLPLK
jgi:hypothetical protein